MNAQLDRKMPFSLEAEQSVLGSILIDPACLDTITSIVSIDDFYLEDAGHVLKKQKYRCGHPN